MKKISTMAKRMNCHMYLIGEPKNKGKQLMCERSSSLDHKGIEVEDQEQDWKISGMFVCFFVGKEVDNKGG
jgi:hypothetical protein